MEEEVWKDIPGYECRYMCSNHGRVMSMNYNKTGVPKCLTEQLGKTGYPSALLSKDGYKEYFLVHRIVALLFLDKQDGKNIVNHIDGNRRNNYYRNLEWCTTGENQAHSIHILGNKTHFQKHHPYKGKFGIHNPSTRGVYQYSKQGNLIKYFPSMSDAEMETGIPVTQMSAVCNGRRKSTGGFIWSHNIIGQIILY